MYCIAAIKFGKIGKNRFFDIGKFGQAVYIRTSSKCTYVQCMYICNRFVGGLAQYCQMSQVKTF